MKCRLSSWTVGMNHYLSERIKESMVLMITFKLEKELELPVNYQYVLQSALYALVRNEKEEEKNYHDEGALYKKRAFRLFTFGRLQGKCRVRKGRIYFRDQISLEVRSAFPEMLEKMSRNLEEKGMNLGRNRLDPFRIYLSDKERKEESCLIEMDSPIVAYRTLEDKQTIFYTPWDSEFYELIKDNFRRKYFACYGVEVPEEEVPKLTLETVCEKDKIVTRYKDFYITSWRGCYLLEGKAKYLDFLYQTGLGCRNSQGFGLFRIKE